MYGVEQEVRCSTSWALTDELCAIADELCAIGGDLAMSHWWWHIAEWYMADLVITKERGSTLWRMKVCTCSVRIGEGLKTCRSTCSQLVQPTVCGQL